MAAEILYLHDLEVEALIPALIASIVGYSVYGAFFGYDADLRRADRSWRSTTRSSWSTTALLGVLCGAGRPALRARRFYGITAFFHRLRLPRWLKPALGGAAGRADGHRPAGRAAHGLRLGADRHEPRACWRCRSGWCCCCRSPRSWPPRSRSAPAGRAASSAPAWSSAACWAPRSGGWATACCR